MKAAAFRTDAAFQNAPIRARCVTASPAVVIRSSPIPVQTHARSAILMQARSSASRIPRTSAVEGFAPARLVSFARANHRADNACAYQLQPDL
jgi:hypothetical protein